MDSYVADSMKEAGFRQAVMGRYPSETVYLLIYQPLLPIFPEKAKKQITSDRVNH